MNLFNFIKEHVSILDVVQEYATLKKAGLYWKGQCPFHNEKTASFTVSPHKEIFYCFGCHNGGDVVTFIAKVENCSPLQAAQHLIDRFKLTPPLDLKHMLQSNQTPDEKARYNDLCKHIAQWCSDNVLKNTLALDYLLKRGFTNQTLNAYTIGYFPGGTSAIKNLISYMNKHHYLAQDLIDAHFLLEGKSVLYSPFEERIIFPIKDHLARFCGFGGRIFKPNDQRPKYYNSRENEYFQKGSLIFGIDLAKKSIQEKEIAFFVEGYTDCMAMTQHGYPNTVATLGTSCTLEHLKHIARYAQQLYVVYDADKAGHQAVLRLTELCWQVDLELKVIILPAKEDPASYLLSNNSLDQLMLKAQDIFDFFIESLGAQFSSKHLHEKITLIRKLISIINTLHDPLKKEILLQKASKILDVPLHAMQKELERMENERPEEKITPTPTFSSEPEGQENTNDLQLEKKIFCAIINNIELFNNTNEKYLLEYLPNPLHGILEKLKTIKDKTSKVDFIQFFDKLSDTEKKYVSSLLLKHEESIDLTIFKQLLLQLHKKNWKGIVYTIKTQISQAKAQGNNQAVHKILRDFQILKQTVFKNFV